MIKKLTDKELINYIPYRGVYLSESGVKKAIEIVRKHRLWEVFLVTKLKFNWDEVHDIAEQLEHIKSQKLVDALDAYLGYPQHDPHGEPIPNKLGKFPKSFSKRLSELEKGSSGQIVGVSQDNQSFLKYLNSLNITLGTSIKVIQKIDFDDSLEITIDNKASHISIDVARNLLIKQK